jgi:hypothetical protein
MNNLVKAFMLTCAKAAGDYPIVDLPALGALSDMTTISGFSSGGYMAHQMHIIFSQYYKGVGIAAGGPYWCAQGSVNKALSDCTQHPENIDIT